MLERKDPEASRLIARLYRENGLRFAKTQRTKAALDAFQRSLEESTDSNNDLKTLLGLCDALVKSKRYSEAAKVSERCLAIDPSNYLAKWMRVETLYKIGEFGNSLVHAHHVGHQRRYPFEEAIHRANETVQNCIGYNTLPDVMLALLPAMKNLHRQRNALISKLTDDGDEFEGIDEDHSKFRVNDANYQREVREKKFQSMLTRRYLDSLAEDVFFVEELVDNPCIQSVNKESTRKILHLAKEFLKRSRTTAEAHRVRKPLYVYYFSRRTMPAAVKRSDFRHIQAQKLNIIVEAHSLLMRLHKARMDRDYSSFFMYVDRVKYKFDSYSERMFPMKKKCLDELYRIVGRAYLDPRDVTRIQNEHTRLLYLKHHLGIRVATFPRDSDLGWMPCVQSSWKKALEILRKRLALASQPLELTWLFHEFAKLHENMGRLDVARYFAKKARDSALEAGDDRWVLNANHILIRIEIHQCSRNEAKDVALLALLGAKKIGIDYLVDFYKRMVKLVEEIDLREISQDNGIVRRERLISNLMPIELKRDMDLLLQRMNFVPAKRRLSLLRGCKPIDHRYDMACTRNTIRQQLPRDVEKEAQANLLRQHAPSRKIPGFIDFDDF